MSKDKKIKVSINTGGKRIRKAIQQDSDEVIPKQKVTLNLEENDPKEWEEVVVEDEIVTPKKQRKQEQQTKNSPKKRNISENSAKVKGKRSRKKKTEDELADGIEIVNSYKKKAAQDREQRIGKTMIEVRQEAKEQASNKRRGTRAFVITFFLVLLVVIAYLFIEYGPLFGFSLFTATTEENKIDLVTTDSDIYEMYNEELLVYSNQKLATYNKNSKKTWEYSLDQMFTPKIYIEGAYMVVANNTNGTIYLFENKREILNKKIEGTIHDIYLDNSGNMAIEYATNGYKKIVGVYTKNGKNLYNSYLENDAIADIEILENGNRLLIAQTNASSFKVDTVLNIVDGTKQTDNIKQLAKLDNNLVYDLTIQGQNIIIVVDNGIYSINMTTGEKKTMKAFDASQMLFISLSNNYYVTAEKKLQENDQHYEILTTRLDGTNISETVIQNSPKMMLNSGVLTYFIYQDGYHIMNKWGIEIKQQHLDLVPKEIVVFNHEKSLALVYTNKIHIVNI